MKRVVRIGTRGSALALAQAGLVKAALEKAASEIACELTVLKTSGDDFAGRSTEPAESVALKGLFVKEIEEALLEKRIDLAVHSVKDLETDLPAGLTLAAVLKREDSRDAAVTRDGKKLKDLPAGSKVGASSLRRQAQLKRVRQDLEFVAIRGNVDTRLRKLDEGECDALILAACGLIRLGLSSRISDYLEPEQMLPSPGQGALGIEIRREDSETARLVEKLNDPNSAWEVAAERAFLKALGGSCRIPVGALAQVEEESLELTGVVLSPDGLKAVRQSTRGAKTAAQRLGAELASQLRAVGADRLLYGSWASRSHPRESEDRFPLSRE